MCGISGIILKKTPEFNPVRIVLKMNEVLKHRGPDGEGLVLLQSESAIPLSTDDTPNISLAPTNYIPDKHFKERLNVSAPNILGVFGHRRLAVVDLSQNGHQPMTTADGDVWITYNGEIYNHLDLRKKLKESGFRFQSNTDTEVILYSYLYWGEDCVKHFEGMWAFVIYDYRKKLFFVSRDRLGIKPFYFIDNDDYICFASEQKALVKSGCLSPNINIAVIYDYLIRDELECHSGNIFSQIKELLPAHNMVYNLYNSKLSINSYYNIGKINTNENEAISDQDLVAKIRKALERSVKNHLQADVDVGIALSGGIDSSSIACIAADLHSNKHHFFSVVFPKYYFNEEYFSSSVVNHIGGIYHKVQPTLDEFQNQIKTLIYALDIPIWDTSTFSQFKMMKEVSKNKIKVILSGQGGDELFSGYDHHYISYWKQLNKENGLLSMLFAILNTRSAIKNPIVFFIKEYIKEYFSIQRHNAEQLLKKEFVESYSNQIIRFEDELNKQLIRDMGNVRLKSYLRCEDRCSMWHGVESRLPFADDLELTHLMFSFNGKRKIKDGISKYFLRESCKDILPAEIYNRQDKKGFTSPTYQWTQDLFGLMKEQIIDADLYYVDKKKLDKMKCVNGNNFKLFFKLYVLAQWLDCYKTNPINGRFQENICF